MSFTSLEFAVLLCITFCAYYCIARNSVSQIYVLVAASAVFYSWQNPTLLVLLIVTAAIAGSTSYVISQSHSEPARTACFWGGLATMLGTLAFFKYGGLFFSTLVGVGTLPEWERFFLNIPLPIGISFYIFHTISLIVDIRRKDYQLEPDETAGRHLVRTCLYIMFFPQLIAGPIIKARHFFPQIRKKALSEIDWESTFRLLTLGYFLKTVIADNLAVQTEAMAYPYYQHYPGTRLIALMVGYSCQIFADFFGYSLIAMGLASLFGYRLPVNFNRPYIADSFAEFWRRWHMSLSTWLRDYLYIPLGGSKHGSVRTYANLFIVMFLGGLWHGAAWSFAIWGTLHGLLLAIERPFLNSRFYRSDYLMVKAARILLVFTFVSFAWIFFKFRNYTLALDYIASIARNIGTGTSTRQLWSIYVFCLPILIYHWLPAIRKLGWATERGSDWAYACMLFLIATNSGVPGAFIYFQF
jgi:alginate O-acetyltransferase complex protein AlgI